MAGNTFIAYIANGRIADHEQLRSVYRRLLLKTHPDAIGSDRLSHKIIQLHADPATLMASATCSG
jgi:hypothetical protein